MAGERGEPVLEHPLQPAGLDVRLSKILGCVCEAESVQSRGEDLIRSIEGNLPFDPYLQLPASFVKFPSQ